ncbi:hypothetical protein [Leptotrichia sp. oral taxon 847]|nr:hypothetical protein [Leptotrichia sp. oral taxon 847]
MKNKRENELTKGNDINDIKDSGKKKKKIKGKKDFFHFFIRKINITGI